MSASGDSGGSRVPMIDNSEDAGLGAAAGAVGGAVVSNLEQATQAAGDVLRGIFGGLPWQMSWSEIVSAVSGKSGVIGAGALEIIVRGSRVTLESLGVMF